MPKRFPQSPLQRLPLLFRPSPIITTLPVNQLSLPSKIQSYNYTFLQSDISNLSRINYIIDSFALSDKTVQCVKEYLKEIDHIKTIQNIRSLPNSIIQKQQPNYERTTNTDVLLPARNTFVNLKFCIMEETNRLLQSSPSSLKIQQLMHLTATFNCLEYQIWNKMIMIGLREFQFLPIHRQRSFVQIVKWYLDKHMQISGSYSNLHQQFNVPFTQIGDVLDWTYFMQKTKINVNKFTLNTKQNLRILKCRVYILSNLRRFIEKQKLKQQFTDIGTILDREPFKVQKEGMLFLHEIFTLRETFRIYQNFASFGILTQSLMNKFESSLLKNLSIQQSNLAAFTPSNEKKAHMLSDYKIYRNLLLIWKSQFRFNESLMQKFVLPALKKKLLKDPKTEQADKLQQGKSKNQESIQKKHLQEWSAIVCGLLCSGYQNIELCRKILQFSGEYRPKQARSDIRSSEQFIDLLGQKVGNKNLCAMFDSYFQTISSKQIPEISKSLSKFEIFCHQQLNKILQSSQIFISKFTQIFDERVYRLGDQYFRLELCKKDVMIEQKLSNRYTKKFISYQILNSFGIHTVFIGNKDGKLSEIEVHHLFNNQKGAQRYLLNQIKEQIQRINQIKSKSDQAERISNMEERKSRVQKPVQIQKTNSASVKNKQAKKRTTKILKSVSIQKIYHPCLIAYLIFNLKKILISIFVQHSQMKKVISLIQIYFHVGFHKRLDLIIGSMLWETNMFNYGYYSISD